MEIKIRAFGLLQELSGGSTWKKISVREGLTIEELILDLGMENERVMNVVKKGDLLPMNYKIKEGDELKIISYITGG